MERFLLSKNTFILGNARSGALTLKYRMQMVFHIKYRNDYTILYYFKVYLKDLSVKAVVVGSISILICELLSFSRSGKTSILCTISRTQVEVEDSTFYTWFFLAILICVEYGIKLKKSTTLPNPSVEFNINIHSLVGVGIKGAGWSVSIKE